MSHDNIGLDLGAIKARRAISQPCTWNIDVLASLADIDPLVKEVARLRVDLAKTKAERDWAEKARDAMKRHRDDYNKRWRSARGQRDVAIRAHDQACQARDILASYRDSEEKKRKALEKEHDELLNMLDKCAEQKRTCLNCKSIDHFWYFNNGESAYCSECAPGPLFDVKNRVDKAEAATDQARIERDEAKADAMARKEYVERLTRQLATAREQLSTWE